MTTRTAHSRDASTAVRRFGLGPKPGDIAQVAADPRGFVLAALANPMAALISDTADLQPSHAVFAALQEARMEQAVVRALVPKTQSEKSAPDRSPSGETMKAASAAVPATGVGQVRRETHRLRPRLAYSLSLCSNGPAQYELIA